MREKHKFPLHFSFSEISKNYIRFLSGKMCTLSKKKSKKQATKHHFISPPEAAKYL
jgi:hypothetical protein